MEKYLILRKLDLYVETLFIKNRFKNMQKTLEVMKNNLKELR